MKRDEELSIIENILNRVEDDPAWFNSLDQSELSDLEKVAGSKYTDPEHFEQERTQIFYNSPLMVALGAEVAAGSYIARTVLGRNIIITRTEEGQAHAFFNSCKHRASKLCTAEGARVKRMVCPYHAWSYNLAGERVFLPDEDAFRKEKVKLDEINLVEKCGMIFISFNSAFNENLLDEFLGEELQVDLQHIDLGGHKVFGRTIRRWPVNWKLAMEGGLENYHFRFVHRNTVGPQFNEQASAFKKMKSHVRFVTPRLSIDKLKQADQRQLRPHAFITYLMVPNVNLFLERNHIALHIVWPISVNECEMVLLSLVPEAQNMQGKVAQYFNKAHVHSEKVLEEDYTIHTGQQESLESNANLEMTVGKHEKAIVVFHSFLNSCLTG